MNNYTFKDINFEFRKFWNKMDGSSNNSLANTSSVSQDLDTSSSAASDQFLYHDLPKGLIEAEERRRQSLESYSSDTGDGRGYFEKPAPIANSILQKGSKTHFVLRGFCTKLIYDP